MKVANNEESVSVVITTYNRKLETLKRAINSVLNQTYKSIQLIVVNACPENIDLEKQIKEYILGIDDIEYICLPKNSGACVARNRGLDESKGKYIAFLDDDDEWTLDKIELQIKRFQELKNKNIGLVYSSFIEIDKDKEKIIKFSNKEGYILKDILFSNIIGGTSNPLLLKEAVEKVNGFDEDFPSSQDYDLWIRICKEYEVGYINKPLVKYYVTQDAITRSMDKRIRGWEKILEKNKELYNKDLKAYNYFLDMIAVQLYINNDKKKSFEYFKRAVKIKKISIKNLKVVIRYIIETLKK